MRATKTATGTKKATYFCTRCGTNHSIISKASANFITRECEKTGNLYTKFVKKEHYLKLEKLGLL
jgi:DNA replicative helicase MCM subunit Mcm2 (Cdc46/Mcm family)